MQLRAPVPRHAPLRSRYGLTRRVRMRRRKLGAIAKLLRPVVVEPVLTGFIALNHGMVRRMRMRGRVLAGRHVAASDMTALCASPKMQPPTAVLKTFDTTIAARNNRRVNPGFAVCNGHAISPKL
jgi:hypothetical protein